MTLRELLAIVPDTTGQDCPTFNVLLQSSEVLLSKIILPEECPARLSVFRNGFATYETACRCNRLRVSEKKPISLASFEGSPVLLQRETFLDEDWSLYLALRAEAQLEACLHTNTRQHANRLEIGSLEETDKRIGYEPFQLLFRDTQQADFLARFIKACKPRDRQLLELYFAQKKTLEEIAGSLNTKKSAVSESLHRILNNAREQARAEGLKVPDGPVKLPYQKRKTKEKGEQEQWRTNLLIPLTSVRPLPAPAPAGSIPRSSPPSASAAASPASASPC